MDKICFYVDFGDTVSFKEYFTVSDKNEKVL